jgi:hypothetical protein
MAVLVPGLGDALPASTSVLTVAAITPATVTGVPTGVTASRQDKSAALSWTAPASDGAAAVDFYHIYTFNSGGSIRKGETSTTTSMTMSGLTNGKSYNFAVYAHNRVGTAPDRRRRTSSWWRARPRRRRTSRRLPARRAPP